MPKSFFFLPLSSLPPFRQVATFGFPPPTHSSATVISSSVQVTGPHKTLTRRQHYTRLDVKHVQRFQATWHKPPTDYDLLATNPPSLLTQLPRPVYLRLHSNNYLGHRSDSDTDKQGPPFTPHVTIHWDFLPYTAARLWPWGLQRCRRQGPHSNT